MQNENTAGRKGISLILLIGGIALLASAWYWILWEAK